MPVRVRPERVVLFFGSRCVPVKRDAERRRIRKISTRNETAGSRTEHGRSGQAADADAAFALKCSGLPSTAGKLFGSFSAGKSIRAVQYCATVSSFGFVKFTVDCALSFWAACLPPVGGSGPSSAMQQPRAGSARIVTLLQLIKCLLFLLLLSSVDQSTS